MKRLALGLSFLLAFPAARASDGGELSPEHVKQDVEYAVHMLRNAYAGSRFQDPGTMAGVFSGLRGLVPEREPMSRAELCAGIQAVLGAVPDMHLLAASPRGRGMQGCAKAAAVREASVGANLHGDPKSEWHLEGRKTPKGKEVEVLAVSSFNQLDGGRWGDFIATADVLFKKPYFIVDLRGNRGGSSASLQKWMTRMYSGKRKFWQDDWELKSPEAARIRFNQWKLSKEWSDDADARRFFDGKVREAEKALESAREPGASAWEKRTLAPLEGSAESVYAGTIYVLMDRRTGSCGEYMVEWLDAVFKVVKLGLPTSGCVHFGNVGLAILPNSGLYIQMGVTYVPTIYGFVEKKGIPPDVPVEDGRDALRSALERIDRDF